MQQPYPPRLQINPVSAKHRGAMLGSPGGAMFASPAAYSAHPFGAGGHLSPDGPTHGAFFPPPYPGGPQSVPMARQVSMASTVSPLTPVAPSALASPFFPASAAPVSLPARPPSLSYAVPPHQHQPHPYRSTPQDAPPRRTTLHASAPSFHLPYGSGRPFVPSSAPPPRGHGKRESVSIAALGAGDDPLRSPTLSRATSASPATSSRRDEPKRKKVIVQLPREVSSSEDDDSEGESARARRPRSLIQRAPLSAQTREAVDANQTAAADDVDVAARGPHPDEVKVKELPPAVDVYLPGKDAWEEVWDAFEQEMTEQHGDCDLRRPTFLPAPPASFEDLFPRRAEHGRTASLFARSAASLPPRLQSVLDSVRRSGSGHGPSLSLSFPSSIPLPRSPSLGSPVALSRAPSGSSSRLTPFAASFVPSSSNLEAAAATSLPRSPLSSPQQVLRPLAKSPVTVVGEKLAPVQERDPGSGRDEDEDSAPARDEDAVEAAGTAINVGSREAAQATEPLELVAPVERAELVETVRAVEQSAGAPTSEGADGVQLATPQVDESEAERTPDARRGSPPSRRASGVSAKTDHTGVASLSESGRSWTDGSDVDEQQGSGATDAQAGGKGSCGDSPRLSHDLSRALSELGTLEAHDAAFLPLLPAINVDEADLSDTSQYGDAELPVDEYSNPSDEEAARARSPPPASQLVTKVTDDADDEDDKPLALLALKAPVNSQLEAQRSIGESDVEDSAAKVPDHKVNPSFSFPPRSPNNSPIKPRAAASIPLPDSSPPSSSSESPQLGSPDFGRTGLPSISDFTFRRPSGDPLSPESPAFGPFGQPGSLTASLSPAPGTPSVSLAPTLVANVDVSRPRTTSTQGSVLKPTAPEFKPSLSSSLPASFGDAGQVSFDFRPPTEAPSLSFSAPEAAAREAAAPPARHVSGSHGPLPPIPLTTVAPHVPGAKRQKGDGGEWVPASASEPMQRVVSAPVLAHPQPRRPLPEPPRAFEHESSLEGDGGQVEILLDPAGDQGEVSEDWGSRSFMSSFSVDDPLPEQYAPVHPVARRRTAGDGPATRAAPHPSVSGLGHGFRPPDLPSYAAREHEAQVSPARMGDLRARVDRGERQESVDIALPSSLRAKSKAIALRQARPSAMHAFDDTFDGPSSSAGSVVLAGSSSSVIMSDDDDDDLPLRILEDLISTQFDELKVGLAAARDNDLPSVDALVEKVATRLQQVFETRLATTDEDMSRLGHKFEEARKGIEQLFADAVERGGNIEAPSRARRPTLLDPTRPLSAPPLRPSTPGLVEAGGPALAYSAFLEDLERIVQPLVRDPVDPAALAATVSSALQSQLADLVASATPSTSSSQVTVAEPAAFEKANTPNAAPQLDGLAEAVAAAVVARIGCSSVAKVHADRLVQAEAGLAAPSQLDSLSTVLQALKTGQDELVDALKSGRAEQTSLQLQRHEDLLEQLAGTVAPPPASAEAAHIADLESQLAKARNEHGKARSEKAVAQDRLETERTRHAAQVGELRAQVAQQRSALEKVERQHDEMRGALAASRGELSGAEKRLAAQDARMDALQRAKAVQQQSLALANQRNAEHEATLAAARSRIVELETASSTADAKLNALGEENVAYRTKLASIEQGLEAMKVAVKGELDEAATKIAQLTAERDRLAAENNRLVRGATDDAPPTHRQAAVANVYPSPPSPPTLEYARGDLSALAAQHTGGSDGSDVTVAHTDFSPTPSVSGQSVVVKDEADGWWSAVVA